MATERTATCPKCSDERTTKAQPNTLIACLGCGDSYRAPALEQGAPVPTVDTPPAAVDKPGPRVQRATATKLPQRARPRARDAATGRLVSAAPMPDTPPPPPPKGQEAAKRAGAKGGRAYYRERVRRAG